MNYAAVRKANRGKPARAWEAYVRRTRRKVARDDRRFNALMARHEALMARVSAEMAGRLTHPR